MKLTQRQARALTRGAIVWNRWPRRRAFLPLRRQMAERALARALRSGR